MMINYSMTVNHLLRELVGEDECVSATGALESRPPAMAARLAALSLRA